MQLSASRAFQRLATPAAFDKTLETFQMSPGAALPHFERFESNGSVLHVQHFAQGVELRAVLPAGRVVVGRIVDGQAPVLRNGTPWRPREAVAFLRGPIDVCTQAPCTLAWLEADALSLGMEQRAADGREPDALCFPETSGALGTQVNDSDSARRAVASAARGLRWAKPCASPGTTRYLFARQVEDLMWQNVDALLSLKAISKLTARSPRSVHYAFTSSFGLGPLSYFKILRLNAVRKWLSNPAQTGAIIDVAAEYGFWHLGHFGTSYKQFFGETPSHTRRRCAGSASAPT